MGTRLTAKDARDLATPRVIENLVDDALALIRQEAVKKNFSVDLTDTPWNNPKNPYYPVVVGILVRLDYRVDFLADLEKGNITRVSW